MSARNTLVVALVNFVLFQTIYAGPSGYVELLNGSPYDWRLVYQHSYQLDWNPALLVPAGTNVEQYVEFYYHWGDHGDCAAEATYELVNSPVPASFTLQVRQENGKQIQVQYHDRLSSLNNPEGSLIHLGWERDGAVSFVLAGDGAELYISTNPPIAWMQATFSKIGSKTISEISMPLSHDAGMSEITRSYGGITSNTRTQTGNVYDQLINGARWFDIRPAYRKGTFYTNHLSGDNGSAVRFGGFGRTINNIIGDINRFTSKYPGELLIIELSHATECGGSWEDFSSQRWVELYALLGNINGIWSANESITSKDLSSVPISTFIQPGSQSAVLIVVPDYAPVPWETLKRRGILLNGLHADGDDENIPLFPEQPITMSQFPGAGSCLTTAPLQGFIRANQLQYSGSYSNTDNTNWLTTDQLNKLHNDHVPSPGMIERSTWTITQQWYDAINIVNPTKSIVGLAGKAHRMLFSKLWPALSTNSYPNLVEVDDIHNSQFAALCMSINNYFASNRSLENRPSTRDLVEGRRLIRPRKERPVQFGLL